MNIIPINDGGITYTREPDEAVIEAIESILAAAKTGEIVAVSFGMLYYDGAASYRMAGRAGSYAMIGATSMLLDDLKQRLRD